MAPAGEGGSLLTNDNTYAERAMCMGDMVRVLELNTPAARFAGTTFGIKTRMAPLSAALARTQFKYLDERNARRKESILYLSERLERLGFHTFQSPPHVDRVYFEFLVRYDAKRWGLDRDQLIDALKAEGCEVGFPRYPLVHQQPLFTEGVNRTIPAMRGVANLPEYCADALPRTQAANNDMLKLPSFPSATRPLLDQYAVAFEKVLMNAEAIARASRPMVSR